MNMPELRDTNGLPSCRPLNSQIKIFNAMKKFSFLTLIACVMTLSITAQELEKKSLSVVGFKPQNLANAPQKVYINNFKIY